VNEANEIGRKIFVGMYRSLMSGLKNFLAKKSA
jgi:hypothetical protein